jgi:hypothetical protein
LQQRLNAIRPSWKPQNLIILFSIFGVLYLVVAIPMLIIAGNVVMFDGIEN